MKKLIMLGVLILTLSACSTTKEATPTEPEATDSNATTDTTSTATEPGTSGGTTATAAVEGTMAANCKLDKDSRVIEVRKTDGGGCELFYTKFGEEKSVASSGFGTQYCEEVKERIETNLNKAGFSCQ